MGGMGCVPTPSETESEVPLAPLASASPALQTVRPRPKPKLRLGTGDHGGCQAPRRKSQKKAFSWSSWRQSLQSELDSYTLWSLGIADAARYLPDVKEQSLDKGGVGKLAACFSPSALAHTPASLLFEVRSSRSISTSQWRNYCFFLRHDYSAEGVSKSEAGAATS